MSNRSEVEAILKKYPETRNDDRLLYTKGLEEFYPDAICRPIYEVGPLVPLAVLAGGRLPHPESYRRRRQEFQSDCRYLPTDPAVLETRKLYRMCPREHLEREGCEPHILHAVCMRCKRPSKGMHCPLGRSMGDPLS